MPLTIEKISAFDRPLEPLPDSGETCPQTDYNKNRGNRMSTSRLSTIALGSLLALAGCTNTIQYDATAKAPTISRTLDIGTLEQSTASMIDAMFADPDVIAATESRRPVLAVYGLVDLTGEQMNVTGLNNDLYAELNKAARFRYADSSRLGSGSTQHADLYDLLESPQAAQPLTNAANADYLLIGAVSKVIRTQPHLKETFYRVSLKLVDPKDKTFLWEEKREFLKSQKKIVYGV